ncbi:MAG: AraC family transcriptional regulator [Pseudomonadota bacterium]
MISRPTIAAGAFARLRPVFEDRRLNFDKMVISVGLRREDLARDDQRIPLNAVVEMLEYAARTVDDDALAIDLAEAYPPGSTGVLGYAVLTAPTVRDAFIDVHRYFRLVTPHQQALFNETPDYGELVWEFSDMLAGPGAQYKTLTLAMMARRVRMATGDDWAPRSVRFDFPRPAAMEKFERAFGNDVQFGTAQCALSVDRDVLGLSMPGSDKRLHDLIVELGDYRLSELEAESDIVDRTQDQIIALLTQGPVSLDLVARDLGQSGRSLQRRLKAEGTSFQTVLEKTRRLLARHYLRTRQYTLAEVTFLLGFSEQSAFTRACRRWFDATPHEVRRRLRESL